ncbi:MAG: hypothetical protein PHT69_05100 [Bacteroidales bacterium]|nr:hypothetical protein [Bacteroidales bacterium]
MKLSSIKEQNIFDSLIDGLIICKNKFSEKNLLDEGFSFVNFYEFKNFAGNQVELEIFEKAAMRIVFCTVTVCTASEGDLCYSTIYASPEFIKNSQDS